MIQIYILFTIQMIYSLSCPPNSLHSLKKRSHKEKRSSYAPEAGVRYDGVYRIEKCWRKISVQVTPFSCTQLCECCFVVLCSAVHQLIILFIGNIMDILLSCLLG